MNPAPTFGPCRTVTLVTKRSASRARSSYRTRDNDCFKPWRGKQRFQKIVTVLKLLSSGEFLFLTIGETTVNFWTVGPIWANCLRSCRASISTSTRIMGTKERKQRELEQRRLAILEKSRDLFFERGYESVSVQDICDEVEYGRSAVYALFSSKEEIYAHIYVESMRILADMFQSVNPAAADFDREFLKSMRILFDFYKYHRNYFKALFYFNTNTLAYSKIPPHILALKEAEIARASMPVMALLKRSMDSGYVRELDVQEVVRLSWATMVGIIMSFVHKEMETDEGTIQRHCLVHAEIYLEGLKTR